MRQLTIMLSKQQHSAYKEAASNCQGVSEWARRVLEYVLLGKMAKADNGAALTKQIPIALKNRIANSRSVRNCRVTIKIAPALHKKLTGAAKQSNVKIAVLCVLLLDCECGLSSLMSYILRTPLVASYSELAQAIEDTKHVRKVYKSPA